MADDIAKKDFSVILKSLNRKFDITDCRWTENRNFEIKFRTHIGVEYSDYNTYCDNWADRFSQATETIWVHKISNTGPKVKFRKQYQCWTHEDKEVQKELLFDPRRCRGTLDIKILGDASSAKKSNKYLRLGLNALIKINFQHLHLVDTKQSFSFFVHHCESQLEASKPAAQPNERVSQLVAKMVENAAITSQKAAERARKALKRQCVVPENFIQTNVVNNVNATNQPDIQAVHTISYKSDNIGLVPQKYVQPVIPTGQMLLNYNGQSTETIYIQEVLFDSSTQTIREVMISGNRNPQVPESLQIPPSMHISQSIEIPHQVQDGESQNIHY